MHEESSSSAVIMIYIQYFIFYLLFIYSSGYEEDSNNSKFVLMKSKSVEHGDLDAWNSQHYGFRDEYFEDEQAKFRDHEKKLDSRPKYDPGWKFIGLGKRPEREYENGNDGINPLLGISTLINFEFFNAIKDGIEDVAKEAVKKEDSLSIGGDESGSLRYNNKINWISGRQKSMYDPGWMLTGLGK